MLFNLHIIFGSVKYSDGITMYSLFFFYSIRDNNPCINENASLHIDKIETSRMHIIVNPRFMACNFIFSARKKRM